MLQERKALLEYCQSALDYLLEAIKEGKMIIGARFIAANLISHYSFSFFYLSESCFDSDVVS